MAHRRQLDRVIASARATATHPTGAGSEGGDAPFGLSVDDVEDALAAGRRLDFDAVVSDLLRR